MLRRVIVTALSAVLLSGLVLATPQAAAATARNGVCESGEVCLYYNSNNAGSLVDFKGSIKNYGTGSNCVKYISSGNGRGQCVKNNAASVWNRKSVPITIFYKSNWSGAIDSYVPGKKANLRPALKNDNAGHLVGKGANNRLEYGVYHSRAGRITAYFDGYLSTSGRHEGIDFARGSGESVYSLTAGTLINKTEGGGGLSTISIYNANLNKSIIYLHTNPLNGLSEGQHIKRGQRIATEAARGASSAHTHVEMRPGRRPLAAVSVGDYTLDNPIPTNFWMNRGYNICCQ